MCVSIYVFFLLDYWINKSISVYLLFKYINFFDNFSSISLVFSHLKLFRISNWYKIHKTKRETCPGLRVKCFFSISSPPPRSLDLITPRNVLWLLRRITYWTNDTYMLLFRWANIGTIQYNKSPVQSFYIRLCTLGDELESE